MEIRLIDADALKKDLLSQAKMNEAEENYDKAAEDRVIIDYLRLVPTIDAAPIRHGHWIHCAGKSNLWYCSECGGKILYNQTRRTYNIKKLPVDEMNRFCRSCGAKMDGGNNK